MSSTDDVSIVSYLWHDENGIVGNSTQYVTNSLAAGTHIFTLYVEDDEGLNDEDEVVVKVNSQ